MARTAKEINEEGFAALVRALGKEDAIRFIRQFTVAEKSESADDDDETLPPMTAEEAHERINDMHGPQDQTSLL